MYMIRDKNGNTKDLNQLKSCYTEKRKEIPIEVHYDIFHVPMSHKVKPKHSSTRRKNKQIGWK